MSRRPKYPTDDLGRALLWRHQRMMRIRERDGDVDPYDALLAVVAPGPDLLEASLAAVRQRDREAAA